MNCSETLPDLVDLNRRWGESEVCLEFWTSSHSSSTLTWTDFRRSLNLLVRTLRQQFPPSGLIVIVWRPHLLSPLAVHAILSAGCSYCPLKWNQMTEGLLDRLNPSGFVVLGGGVGDESVVPKLVRSTCVECPLVCSDGMHLELSLSLWVRSATTTLKPPQSYNNIAYHIFTSGSTGEAKLVRVPHACIVPNLRDLLNRFTLRPNSGAILNCAPLTFDPSVVEIYLALSSGCRLVMPSRQLLLNPDWLCSVVLRRGISLIQCTPGLFLRFGERHCRQLVGKGSPVRWIIFGGESAPPAAKLFAMLSGSDSATKFYTIYGVTEVSCWATFGQLDLQGEDGVNLSPLGEPMLETRVELRPSTCDVDVYPLVGGAGRIGELWIGRRNAPCCVEDTLAGELWPTGDLAFESASSGRLYFLGRKDRVIKRQGHKVNLTLLETTVMELSEVALCSCSLLVGDVRVLEAAIQMTDERCCPWVEKMRLKIIGHVRQHLGDPYVPDRIRLVTQLPLSNHGKTTTTTNVGTADRRRVEMFSEIWETFTGLPPRRSGKFLDCGGSSLSAVYLANLLEDSLELDAGWLLPLLFDLTFDEICQAMVGGLSSGKADEATKRLTAPAVDTPDVRDQSLEDHAAVASHFPIELWSYPLGKCIDASPLLVVDDADSGDAVVFIGSHSHAFVALGLTDGLLRWRRELPDRLEATAAISRDANFILVGCYDGALYVLERASGRIHWTYRTGDVVKTTPAVNHRNDLVILGSHDKHVHAVDIGSKRLVWKRNIDSRGIVSSPRYDPINWSRVLVATLGGTVACLSDDSGLVLWKCSLGNPIFSTPLIWEKLVVVASVDGIICSLDLDSGENRWQFKAPKAVFSSPVVSLTGDIFVGCHDGCVYQISATTGCGEVVFSGGDRTPIYSTPAVTIDNAGRSIVCAAATSGRLFAVDPVLKELTWSYELPAEVFSSPVLHTNCLVIGCRDDRVHAFQLADR